MTNSHFEKALNAFKKTGATVTPQREIILAYLVDSHCHPTAKKIYSDLNEGHQHISLATVYNTLEALIKAKLVIDIEDSKTAEHHFDYFGSPHYHIICDRCGSIVDGEDFDFSSLLKGAEKESGYLLKSAHVEVHGLCPNCQKKV
ncbi:Fur family transcriptional regulator [Xylocopilactobacillus apicola]|uniref:Transcriptional repressor n=1 Tax=Xylocopilactobacillus apicola TaxID=2932184 RepID=A0AAU9CZX2_9LACO|nr:Fur family transcriptional regulator [Xylocopilactobacillus apicola]BDR59549.1 transcriptional repressor [Xylocopilactobacillus apicola]